MIMIMIRIKKKQVLGYPHTVIVPRQISRATTIGFDFVIVIEMQFKSSVYLWKLSIVPYQLILSKTFDTL